jgi:Rrf2 family protein
MELIRQDTDYTMRALVHLAARRDEGPLAAKALASACDIPEDFAYKILQRLTKSGIVESHMGVQGGFVLARNPQEINLLEIVEAVQGPVAVRKCLLGKEEACPRHPSCPVAAKLGGLQDTISDFLSSITLADVLEAGSQLEAPLQPTPRR